MVTRCWNKKVALILLNVAQKVATAILIWKLKISKKSSYIWLKICHQKLLKNRPTWSHWGLPKFYIQLHNSVTRLDTEEFDEFEEVEFVLSFLKGLDFMITGGWTALDLFVAAVVLLLLLPVWRLLLLFMLLQLLLLEIDDLRMDLLRQLLSLSKGFTLKKA